MKFFPTNARKYRFFSEKGDFPLNSLDFSSNCYFFLEKAIFLLKRPILKTFIEKPKKGSIF